MVQYYCTGCETLVEDDKRCNCGQEWVQVAGVFLLPSSIGVIVSLCKQENILISFIILVIVISITLCCHFSCHGNKDTRVVIHEPLSSFQNNLYDHLMVIERKEIIEFSQESNTNQNSKITKENLIQKDCKDQTCMQKEQFPQYYTLPPQTYDPSPYTQFKQTVDDPQIVEQQNIIIKNEKVSNKCYNIQEEGTSLKFLNKRRRRKAK